MKISGSKLLLVGGAGLIGSHITDLLLKQDVAEVIIFDNFIRGTMENLQDAAKDPRVKIINGDINDYDQVEKVVKEVDGVFLLAALWLLECAERPLDGLQVNVNGNMNVVEACVKHKIKRLVFSSSASVYGNAIIEPMPEDHPLNNDNFYGATKVSMEQLLHAYHKMYGLNHVNLRYFNVYGPRQDYKGAYISVIMKALDKIDVNESPVIFGDGSQSYDFIYVKDIARSNIVAMESDVADQSFNIATGTKTSISDLIKSLITLSGSTVEPEYVEAAQSFVTNRIGSVDKAKNILGFESSTKLSDGLKELIEWRANRIKTNK